ncbi:hypothetical protein BJP08_01255 [Corynebacterium sp. NML140438]|nr:hypothetical protein BJP08_01255 [Corynebacterium sp. NML140438]
MVPELGNYFSGHERANELAWGKRVRRAAGAPENVKKFPDAGRGNFLQMEGRGMGAGRAR